MKHISIEQGLVSGSQWNGVYQFLGMPYAAPPVGELRWQPPAPPASWEGVRDATEFGNAAIQTRSTGFDPGAKQSEDCLYLNVWSPTLDPDARLPVMLWIHGGGFLNGAASMKEWLGGNLARRGVTVVSCNYRLGAFGFLAHPQAGANFAVLDWVAALRWVAQNIHAFGGNPDNVTIFGQSAGGAAVRVLLSTHSAHGLFHRAIIQSAGYEPYAAVPSPSYQRIIEFSEKVCDYLGSHDIEELRQVPAEKVREASLLLSGSFPPAGQVHTPANLVWYPTADGQVVDDAFSGWPTDVPVLFGCTQNEARLFIKPTGIYGEPETDPAKVYTQQTLEHMARALGGEHADDILAYFAGTSLTPYEALAELITIAIWLEPALATYQRFAKLDRTSYAYRFARVSPGARRSGLLAYHSAEIPYLFGTLTVEEPTTNVTNAFGTPSEAGDYNEVDTEVANVVQHAWTEFARTGIPSNPDGIQWPRVNRSNPQFTVIADLTQGQPLDISPVTQLINTLRVKGDGREIGRRSSRKCAGK
jgi:para-nitrobenzyl esterase